MIIIQLRCNLLGVPVIYAIFFVNIALPVVYQYVFTKIFLWKITLYLVLKNCMKFVKQFFLVTVKVFCIYDWIKYICLLMSQLFCFYTWVMRNKLWIMVIIFNEHYYLIRKGKQAVINNTSRLLSNVEIKNYTE